MFKKHDHLNINGYTDVDWIGSSSVRKSTFRYFFVEGNLVTWKSKNQKVTALLSAKAEFRGI